MEIESRLYIYLLAAGVSLLVILQAVNGQQVPPMRVGPLGPQQPPAAGRPQGQLPNNNMVPPAQQHQPGIVNPGGYPGRMVLPGTPPGHSQQFQVPGASAPVQPYPGTNMDPNARFGQQHGGDQQQVGYFTKNNQLNPANDTRLQQQETSSPLSGGAAQSAGRNPSDEPSAASAGSPQEAPPEVFIAGIGLLTAALHFLM